MRPSVVLLLLLLLLPNVAVVRSSSSSPFRSRPLLAPPDPIGSRYRQKPHDAALYDVLGVPFDAASGEIAKSYRRLSLRWHPDRLPRRPRDSPDDAAAIETEREYARARLRQIARAYEILSDDRTRLLYHRYGIRDGVEGAVRLLSGSASSSDDESRDLLRLMGYPPPSAARPRSHPISREERLQYLTWSIVEKLRPLVEGTTAQDVYVQAAYDECRAWSGSALGKHILRCVGRAYRREGRRVLRTARKTTSTENDRAGQPRELTDFVRDSWRDIRHFASAAVASGKLILVESKLKRLRRERERRRNGARDAERMSTRGGKGVEDRANRRERDGERERLFLDIGSLTDDAERGEVEECMFSDDEDMASEELDDDHFQHLANEKTYAALLSAHQTEVLWKLTKMDLDSTVSEACRRMLAPTKKSWNGNRGKAGWYSFFPSEASPYPNEWHHHPSSHHSDSDHHAQHYYPEPQDGWVGLDGNVVPMEVGRLRAAAALVLVGDIMVRCGKDSA